MKTRFKISKSGNIRTKLLPAALRGKTQGFSGGRCAFIRSVLIILLCMCMLCGCSVLKENKKQYTATFFDLFDTVTTVVGRETSQEAFDAKILPLKEELERYHKLFDIYNEYEGVNNLKTVNDRAGTSPVKVDEAILALVEDCKHYYIETNGVFNPAMGSVLSLWHDAREDSINAPNQAYLPDDGELKAASLHTDPEDIVIDRENSTIYFSDPLLKLDVGAIAKGWAVERISQAAPRDLLISVGGNVYATGPKSPDGEPWAVGIQDPANQSSYLDILSIKSGSVVTSGSYNRTYTVNGKQYHHIINPETLYPGELWTSVTVICEDSGLADVLSTSLFLLDRENGQALLDRFGARALWLDKDGNKFYSTGF